MPYRLLSDGTIECDTLDEISALQKKAGRQAPNSTKSKSAKGQDSTPLKELSVVIAEMTPQARTVLQVVKAHDQIELKALRQEIPGMSENHFALSGVLAAIQKVLKREAITPGNVLRRTAKGYGSNRTVTYAAGPALKALVEVA